MSTPILNKKDGVYIALVIDRSGSMYQKKNEVIEGVNGFFDKQKELEGSAKFSLTFFDTSYENLVINANVKDFNKLDETNYKPVGGTALNDAVAAALNAADHAANGRKVLVVIVTDGEENSSVKYSTQTVKQMIEARQSQGWDFTYIGAGLTAWDNAKSIGITRATDFVKYDPVRLGGTKAAFMSASTSVSNSRLYDNKMETDYREEAKK